MLDLHARAEVLAVVKYKDSIPRVAYQIKLIGIYFINKIKVFIFMAECLNN
jgi:hypothetical protein